MYSIFLRPHEGLSSIYRVSESIDPRFSSNPRKCYDRSYSSWVYFFLQTDKLKQARRSALTVGLALGLSVCAC